MPPLKLSPLELGNRSRSYVCLSCLSSLNVSPNVRANGWFRMYGKSAKTRPAHSGASDESLTSITVEDKPEVRYFNEELRGQFRQLSDNEEYSKAISGLDEEVESTINELEKKLQDTARLFQLMERYGMKDKAYELKRQYGSRQAIQGSPPDIPEDSWPRSKGYHISRLNTYLKNAFEDISKGKITPKIVSSTWKYYSAARSVLSTSWDKVPKEVWELLWQILSCEKKWNLSRMAHVHVLAKDMNSAGMSLDASRQLLAIEAMFVSGWQKEAIDNWKKAASTLGSKSGLSKDYWELGVRMNCHFGDLERAERAVDALFELSKESDPRILIPLIRAYARTEATGEQAWQQYRRLRGALGKSMQIEDYDEVIGSFLAGNHTELGLQAFVDMMFSSHISIRGKPELPLIVGNQFFLGKWLKRLIGAGDLDGAFNVIKYMEKKGIMGSAVQVNGLIGAWLRSETAENVGRAEDLAWAMIQSRLVFVKLRQREALLEWPMKLSIADSDQSPGLRFVPKATLETFCLMAENYRRRGLYKEMERLWAAFGEAEIATNSFMMNQLIESFIQNGEAEKATDFYRSMTQEHHIRPDAYTFLALYKSLSVNRLLVKYDELVEQDIVMARQFFRDMVHYPWQFDSETIYEQLPRSILHSFLKLGDYGGLLAACRAMQKLFDFAPSEALLVELAAGSTALRSPNRRNTKLLLEASRLIEILLEQRHAALELDGRSLQSLAAKDKARELGLVLEQLILRKAQVREEELRPLYETAAREMGVDQVVISSIPQEIAKHRKIK
ncbi:hypothetical protein VTK73DRAFT_1227 [Phialemonium thermophilum]|uniref:Pentatricopeptide repeat-containing protein n=1 Tax=Phialemonium thermophilum TaxID=223376 RepID=A0ABR3Y320_9PEZI